MPVTLPVIFSQDFDSNTSWTFTSDVAFFQNGSDGYYDISNRAEFPSLLLNNIFFWNS